MYMKGKPHKYGIEVFQLCEANVAMYTTSRWHTHTLLIHNTALQSVLLIGK